MIRAVLSIGANQGDALGNLNTVFEAFKEETVATSGVYATPPWGGVEQGDFLNAVLIVETDRTPLELLRAGQALESEAGRVREVRWGPRTLDVDVVQIIDLADGAELVSDNPVLTLPHPWAHARAFVLVPWLDADRAATLEGERVTELVAKLDPDEVAAVRLYGSDQQL